LWPELEKFKSFGTWDAAGLGLGGWSIDPYHAYDPVSRTLYLGDGTQRRRQAKLDLVIDNFAGTSSGCWEPSCFADGQPASKTGFARPSAVETNADGLLSAVASPLGDRVQMTYAPGGLLTWLRDARGQPHQYAYEPNGRKRRP